MTVEDKGQAWTGVVLITASAVAFSTAGLFTRLIDLDVWTMLFWRGIVGGTFIGCTIAWQHGRRTETAFRAIGTAGVLAAVCSTLATICFINALRHTTVADVLVINATAPFITAALAWLCTAEREGLATLIASVVALLGVASMVHAGLAAGHLAGDLLALMMTILISAMMVIVRSRRDISMLPAACLSAFLCAIVVWPISRPGIPSGMNCIYLVLFGSTQFGLGLLLLTLGTRLISATRSALIGSLETPLAPAWVWLAVGEIPSVATCVGGLIVLGAVVGDIVCSRRTPRRSGMPPLVLENREWVPSKG
jgi:drug/metabolite transporter (DMT)-like permease